MAFKRGSCSFIRSIGRTVWAHDRPIIDSHRREVALDGTRLLLMWDFCRRPGQS